MAYKLATILTDVELQFDIDKTVFHGFNEDLKKILIKYEMHSLLNRVFKQGVKKNSPIPPLSSKAKITADKQDQMGLF